MSAADFASAPAMRPVITVSELVGATRLLIERNLPLSWVSGEISNFTRAASGHCYFVLKDSSAQVRCVFFRNKAALTGFALRDGLQVELRALPTLYEARGEFQLNVDAMRVAGAGALYQQFARLKSALEARGWFAAERKRALLTYPRAIGIVTSTKGAALHDVLSTLKRRSPQVRIVVYPCAVQGRGAAHEIAQAIRIANARRDADRLDTLIVCRGGGSIEDLWSFNEEIVALAIIESALPVVSGVGHETDFTICDFVADVRAPTPTGAAQLAAPARDELDARVRNLMLHVRSALGRHLEREMQRVDYLGRRLQHPAARLAAQRKRLAQFATRIHRCVSARLARDCRIFGTFSLRWRRRISAVMPQERMLVATGSQLARAGRVDMVARQQRLDRLAVALRHLNPASVLERGYAIVTTSERTVVQSADALQPGQSLSIRFARGSAESTVTAIETSNDHGPEPDF